MHRAAFAVEIAAGILDPGASKEGIAPFLAAGRRIILATDRPIGFWELYNNDRSVDYPFMLIEIRLNERGEGEGRMSVATRIELSPDGKQLQLENYSSQPVLLRNIRRVED